MFGMSFYEKSAWGTLLATSLVGALYFNVAWNLWAADRLIAPAVFGVALGFTIMLVVLLVIFHILIAVVDRPGDEDERDRLIGWRAAQWSGFALFAGVTSIIGLVLFAGFLVDSALHAMLYSPMVIIHLLMLVVLSAQLIDLGARIVFYRRGV